MKYKKIFCLISAFLMLSSAVPAYAAKANTATKVKASCDLPKISVSVPATGKVLINPYKLSMKVGNDVVDDQVVTIPWCIKNESAVPLRVSVTVTGAVKSGSDMLLKTVTTEGTGLTSKSAFLYFEMKAADSEEPPESIWDSGYDTDQHVVVRNGYSKTKKDIVELGAVDQKGCYGAFRLTGDCVATPKKGWTDADGVNVEIAFTFQPLHVDTEINT